MRRTTAAGLRAGMLAAAAWMGAGGAQAADADKYPRWDGQWQRVGGAQYDPAKPGRDLGIPFTPEMQKRFDAVVANRKEGGLVDNFSTNCVPIGMPRMTVNYERQDVIVTPSTTYIWDTEANELRRIYTDGRSWPEKIAPGFLGYSVGAWKDSKGDGLFDTLEVESRSFLGPRTYDSSGAMLDPDGQSVIKERFTFDRAEPNKFTDEITTIDHALTRPYTIKRTYTRAKKNVFSDTLCALDESYLILGDENYFISADGFVMPAKKGQRPPDLKYFSNAGK